MNRVIPQVTKLIAATLLLFAVLAPAHAVYDIRSFEFEGDVLKKITAYADRGYREQYLHDRDYSELMQGLGGAQYDEQRRHVWERSYGFARYTPGDAQTPRKLELVATY